MKQRIGESPSQGLTVLLDLDGVVADLERSFHAHLRSSHPDLTVLPAGRRTSFRLDCDYPRHVVEQILGQPGFFRQLDPVDGAIDGVASIVERGHLVRICSSPFHRSRSCETEKRCWVQEHLGDALADSCIFVSDKTSVRGDILIDDFPRHVGATEPTWRQVLFDQHYNRRVETRPLHTLAWSTVPVRWDGWHRLDDLMDALNALTRQP